MGPEMHKYRRKEKSSCNHVNHSSATSATPQSRQPEYTRAPEHMLQYFTNLDPHCSIVSHMFLNPTTLWRYPKGLALPNIQKIIQGHNLEKQAPQYNVICQRTTCFIASPMHNCSALSQCRWQNVYPDRWAHHWDQHYQTSTWRTQRTKC